MALRGALRGAGRVKIEVVQGGLGLDAYDENIPSLLSGVPHEPTTTTNLRHQDGTLSMARLDPGTATSEVGSFTHSSQSRHLGGMRLPLGLHAASAESRRRVLQRTVY